MSPERLGARRGALSGLALVAVATAGLWRWAAPEPPVPRPTSCVRAALVDGHLRCDDELPATPSSLCEAGDGGEGTRTSVPLAPGDALDTARLCVQPVAHPGGPGWSRMAPAELAALDLPVELNRASEQELTSLPRVGPVIARRIVEGRPYAAVDDLLRVRGIGPVTLERVRPRVLVEPPASPSP